MCGGGDPPKVKYFSFYPPPPPPLKGDIYIYSVYYTYIIFAYGIVRMVGNLEVRLGISCQNHQFILGCLQLVILWCLLIGIASCSNVVRRHVFCGREGALWTCSCYSSSSSSCVSLLSRFFVCMSLPYRCPFPLWVMNMTWFSVSYCFVILCDVLCWLHCDCALFSTFIGTPLTGGNKPVEVCMPNLYMFHHVP